MKNAFKILILFTIICYGCDPRLLDRHTGEWFIHNATDQTILVDKIEGVDYPINIAPEKTIKIVYFYFDPDLNVLPYFEKLFETWDNSIIINILSENEELLTSWSLSEKDEDGKQFFNESSWEKSESISDDRYKNVTIKWTFNIDPEDID